VVLGLDDAASGAALAGDVTIASQLARLLAQKLAEVKNWPGGVDEVCTGLAREWEDTHRSTSSPRSFSMVINVRVRVWVVFAGVLACRCCRRWFWRVLVWEFRATRLGVVQALL
jgi:hypothetical protein